MWTKLLSISMVVIMLFTAMPVMAQDDTIDHSPTTYEVYKLPKGLRVEWSGEKYQMYNLGEYKMLLQMDADLRYFTEKKAQLEGENYNLTVQVDELKLAIEDVQKQRDVLREDRDRLHEKWKSENRRRHEAENKPTFGSSLPWFIAAGLGVLSTGLIFALVVSE